MSHVHISHMCIVHTPIQIQISIAYTIHNALHCIAFYILRFHFHCYVRHRSNIICNGWDWWTYRGDKVLIFDLMIIVVLVQHQMKICVNCKHKEPRITNCFRQSHCRNEMKNRSRFDDFTCFNTLIQPKMNTILIYMSYSSFTKVVGVNHEFVCWFLSCKSVGYSWFLWNKTVYKD